LEVMSNPAGEGPHQTPRMERNTRLFKWIAPRRRLSE
jgi:hypothetical protein